MTNSTSSRFHSHDLFSQPTLDRFHRRLFSMPIQHVATLAEFNTLIRGDKVVVIDFTAVWCPPCQMIKPIFEKLSEQFTHIVFLKVDVDEQQDIAAQEGIRAMPTFKIYQKGVMKKEIVGANVRALTNAVASFEP